MRIEIDSERSSFLTIALLVIALLLIGFGVIGKQVTPLDGSVLNWNTWQAQKAHTAAERELLQYQSDFRRLEQAFTEPPDPIAVRLLTAEILHNCELEIIYLPTHRQQLLNATEAVQNWALKILETEDVTEVLLNTEEFLFAD